MWRAPRKMQAKQHRHTYSEFLSFALVLSFATVGLSCMRGSTASASPESASPDPPVAHAPAEPATSPPASSENTAAESESDEHATSVAPTTVCDLSDTRPCARYCATVDTCVRQNAALAEPMLPFLEHVAFADDTCEACVAHCQRNTTAGIDAKACVSLERDLRCGNGLEGAAPFFEVFDACCERRQRDPTCVALCDAVAPHPDLSSMLQSCR